MTDQVFPNLPQTPPPEPPADPPAQEEPAKALTPAREMADALSAPEVETPDVSDSPFCRAMGLIAGGLAVTGVTLNFWNLDVLLPLGHILPAHRLPRPAAGQRLPARGLCLRLPAHAAPFC